MVADELTHHGILGQRWGVRRYQNEDGSYKNDAARERHAESEAATSPAQNGNRSRNIKRAVAITAGILATGAIAYGLYKTGAYKHGVDAAKKIFGSKGDQVAEKVKIVRELPSKTTTTVADKVVDSAPKSSIINRAKTKVKKTIIDTLDDEKRTVGIERAIDSRIDSFVTKSAEAKKTAHKVVDQAAKRSVSDIPKSTSDRGRQYVKRGSGFGTKIKDAVQKHRINKQAKRATRAVNNFNQANADFVNNLGNMGWHRR